MSQDLIDDLNRFANIEKAKLLQRFFKTGKGEYGEGDVFLGVMVPESRKIAKKYSYLNLDEVERHLKSKFHEERLIALLILVEKYKKSQNKKEIVEFYLKNLNRVNNWDLVDLTAHKILGVYLSDKDKGILHNLAKSNNMWERRVSVISTFDFIKKGKFEQTLKIVEMLMEDKEDLIHKACGWALREVGKKNEKYLETFLAMHYKKMPRTMLRYAIEKLDKGRRRAYLKGEV